MSNGDTIVQAARAWIGTPYVHQAGRRGAGTDCLGLIRGIWRELIGEEPVPVPAYTMDWAEPQGEERLWRAARHHLREKPVAAMEAGDVILFRMKAGSVAKHLAILTEGESHPRFVHAYCDHGVVENSLTEPWRRRIVACFEFPLEVC